MRIWDNKEKRYLPEDSSFDFDPCGGDYVKIVFDANGKPIYLSSTDCGKDGIHEHYLDAEQYKGRFFFDKL